MIMNDEFERKETPHGVIYCTIPAGRTEEN
jgi:hypothetical protein